MCSGLSGMHGMCSGLSGMHGMCSGLSGIHGMCSGLCEMHGMSNGLLSLQAKGSGCAQLSSSEFLVSDLPKTPFFVGSFDRVLDTDRSRRRLGWSRRNRGFLTRRNSLGELIILLVRATGACDCSSLNGSILRRGSRGTAVVLGRTRIVGLRSLFWCRCFSALSFSVLLLSLLVHLVFGADLSHDRSWFPEFLPFRICSRISRSQIV